MNLRARLRTQLIRVDRGVDIDAMHEQILEARRVT